MNIKRAKQAIKDSIEAYLAKDEFGEYLIPAIRQRPILLMGAPGIGKTQIMEQIARECKVGLVSYTITHHTRQSAVGPIWNGGNQNEKELLASCYLSSMQLALEHKIRKIAFPSISTGVYSFPVGLAAKIAVNTVTGFLKEHPDDFDLVEWVLFDEHTELVYAIEVNAHNKGI